MSEPLWWLLDADMTPVSCPALSRSQWLALIGYRYRVARTELPGDVVVSTVFLGHSPTGTGRMWETVILGGPLDGRLWRWPTHEEARQRHPQIVDVARRARRRV